MTNKELKSYVDRILGNSLRCLLPSYWWKRLFGLIVDKVGEIEKSVGNKQEKLVSGETIKTINGEDILGGGNIEIKNEQKVESVTFVVGFDDNGNVHLDDDDLAQNKASFKAYVGNKGLRLQLSYYLWDGSKKIKYGNSCPDVAGLFNYVAQNGVGEIIFVNVNLGETAGVAVYGGSVNVGFGNTGEAAIEPYFTTNEMNYLYYGVSGTGANELRNRNVQLRKRLLKQNYSAVPICIVDLSTTGIVRTIPATLKRGIRGGETVVWISYEENGCRYTYLFEENGTLTEDDVTEIGGGVVYTELSADSSNAIANSAVTAALKNKVDKVDGKQLSTEDFTSLLKAKLDGLSNYDDTSIRNAINSLTTQINTLVSGDASVAIESFNEIIAFLNGIEDSESLDSIIAAIEQQIAGCVTTAMLAQEIANVERQITGVAATIPQKTSQLNNDSGFTTEEYVNTQVRTAIISALNTEV